MAAVVAFLLLILLRMASPHGAPRCPGCGLTALTPPAQRRVLLAMAQHSILARLHLPERPRAPHPPTRAALLSALRRVQPRLVAPPQPPSTAEQNYEVLSFAEAGPSTPRTARLLFRFSQDLRGNAEVLQAHLHLFRPSPGPGSSQPVSVRLLQGDAAQNSSAALSEEVLEVRGEGWAVLDVSDALRSALSRGTEQLTVELSTSRPPGPSSPTYGDTHRPFVVVRARTATPPRRRRRGIDCSGATRMCCRKEFFVDFREIGWEDWIIQPEGYHMNYCAGLCPPHVAAVPGVAASFHTAVLNLIKANNADAAADSCCVPTQRRPLSLLYYDRDSNIVKTDIPDMIVDACGCT